MAPTEAPSGREEPFCGTWKRGLRGGGKPNEGFHKKGCSSRGPSEPEGPAGRENGNRLRNSGARLPPTCQRLLEKPLAVQRVGSAEQRPKEVRGPLDGFELALLVVVVVVVIED